MDAVGTAAHAVGRRRRAVPGQGGVPSQGQAGIPLLIAGYAVKQVEDSVERLKESTAEQAGDLLQAPDEVKQVGFCVERLKKRSGGGCWSSAWQREASRGARF